MFNFIYNGNNVDLSFIIKFLLGLGSTIGIIFAFFLFCLSCFSFFITIYTVYWIYKLLDRKIHLYTKDKFIHVCILYGLTLLFLFIFILLQSLPSFGFFISFIILSFGRKLKKIYKNLKNDFLE